MNMIRHDLDLSGLGPSFSRYCASLNTQRMNHVPHRALNGKTPASVLFPHKSLPFRHFLPFGCKASVLQGAAARKANKLDPRGRDGVYIGTATAYGMQGFLVYLFPERGHGAGTVVVATHAKFDVSYFPARKSDRRVDDFYATLSCKNDSLASLSADLLDCDGLLELQVDAKIQHDSDDEGPAAATGDDGPAAVAAEFIIPAAGETDICPTEISAGTTAGTVPSQPPSAPNRLQGDFAANAAHGDGETATVDLYDHTDSSAWTEIEYGDAIFQEAISTNGFCNLGDLPADLAVPEPILAYDASSVFADIQARAENQPDPGRKLRSGTIQARQASVSNDMADMVGLLHDAKIKHAFAARVHEKDQRIRALSATTTDDGSAFAWQAVEHIRAKRKQRHRFLTDVCTGERIDFDDGYHNFGANDLTPDGCIETSSFQRLLVKALKTAIRDQPTNLALKKDLQLLRTPSTAKEALASPQWREWKSAIDKELSSLVKKQVYEVRKIPPGTKAIPTKLVLRIKLNSDGSVDKYKVRCVALGFLQRAGLHYHPDECYSPMSDPSTTRTLVALSNALDLTTDHLDVSVAYLNGVLDPAHRFFCLPPPGFDLPAGYGWYMLRGLYGTRQGGAVWAKTFRDWMKREQPQFVEAGNERVCYVFREHADGTSVDLDTLRGLTLEPNEKLIILCMNTDDMLISYTENARHLVDEFERTLNLSYECTPRVPLEYYLGMHIVRNREQRVLSIDVRRHIYDFIRSMGLDPNSSASVSTPLDPNLVYSKDDCPQVINTEIKERVLRAHGKLIHMAIWARPDLAHCVSVLGRYVHNPSQKHLDAYLRVARYLIKTKDLRIVYGSHDKHGMVLYGFSDSDWSADIDTRKSTGAYIFLLDGAACSWKVKLSSTALLSSQESEYVAASEATKEALNLRMLLLHLGFGDPRPTDIFVDNKGAITMGLHPSNKPATRHVDMRVHMLRQHVELGHVSTPFCPTYDMVADYMTKATPKPTHERHRARAMGDQDIAPALLPIQHLLA